MDYRKLDGALASALEAATETDDRLPVFIRIIQTSAAAAPGLREVGIERAEGTSIYTADLSRAQVAWLSDQPWVVSIRLGRIARPLSPS